MQQLQAALDQLQASEAASQAAFQEVLQRKDEELVRLMQHTQSLQETSAALQAGLAAAQQRCTTLEEDSGVRNCAWLADAGLYGCMRLAWLSRAWARHMGGLRGPT